MATRWAVQRFAGRWRRSCGESNGWRPLLKGDKPAFVAEHNAALTGWMESNLHLSWCAVEEPWTHEVELINEMQRPLNSDHDHSHAFYPTLKRLRRELMAAARSNGPAA